VLRRLAAYLERVFEFRHEVDSLRDSRRRPQIDTASVWLCCFAMFTVRLRSFNAVEQDLRRPKRWERFVGRRKPSADTMGRVCGKLSLDSLRRVLVNLNRQAWRAKTVHRRPGELYRVVAVDGHELRASRARCCEQCLIRDLKLGERTVREYYHRVVVAQWVGVTPPGLLDVELVRPGEGEVVAARRLLERIFKSYGRLIDVVCGDAIYLEAPFCRMVLEAHKHFVVVMKQEARELYQDADRLRMLSAPQQVVDGAKTSGLWDLSDLSSFTTLGHKVRVVWAEETTTKRKIVGGEKKIAVEANTWIWVTDLPTTSVPAIKIARWGHDRWDLENRGFNELSALWGMDHCFVHNPVAIQTLLLTLAIAFLTTYVFYERNLKSDVRRHMTRLALADRLREDLCLPGGASLWPPDRPSG
jgi:hypothetical protein